MVVLLVCELRAYARIRQTNIHIYRYCVAVDRCCRIGYVTVTAIYIHIKNRENMLGHCSCLKTLNADARVRVWMCVRVRCMHAIWGLDFQNVKTSIVAVYQRINLHLLFTNFCHFIEFKTQITANLDVFIRRFNEIQFWVVSEIVSQSSITKRVLLIRKFIKLAA